MADEKPYEITIIVSDAGESETKHYEAPLSHKTVRDVILDLGGTISTRSNGKMKEIKADR